jgi:hypothetical protein
MSFIGINPEKVNLQIVGLTSYVRAHLECKDAL